MNGGFITDDLGFRVNGYRNLTLEGIFFLERSFTYAYNCLCCIYKFLTSKSVHSLHIYL